MRIARIGGGVEFSTHAYVRDLHAHLHGTNTGHEQQRKRNSLLLAIPVAFG
jgi:hypothetical protein